MDVAPWLGLGEAATLRSFSGLRVSPMPRWAMVCTNIKTDKRQVSTWVFIVLKCLLNGFNGISFVGCFSHRCFCGGSTKFDGWAAQASPYSTLSNSPWKGSKSPLHFLTRSSLTRSLRKDASQTVRLCRSARQRPFFPLRGQGAWDTNRKPQVLPRLPGALLLRFATPALLGVMNQEPPRKTRSVPVSRPVGLVCDVLL